MSDHGNDAQPIDDEGGGSKKKMLLFIVPILLLIGGGAAAYFTGMLDGLLGKTAEATEEHGEEKAGADAGAHGEEKADGHGDSHGGEKKAEGGDGHGDGHAGPVGPAFLKIPDMIVNLNTQDGQPRYLRLAVQLELNSEADKAAVEAVLPRVVDQFQTYLRELRVTDLKGSKGIYRLQIELLSRVNSAAAPVKVKDVLFQEILIQ